MRRALIVVDMLHEFVDGRLGGEKARAIVPACRRVLDHAREQDWPVAFACDGHFEDDPEIAVWGEHAMRGSAGTRVVDELRPRVGRVVDELDLEDVFPKRAYSALSNLRLEPWLRQRTGGPGSPGKPTDTEVVLVGTATHICVAQTAIDAFQSGFHVAVVADATCAFDGVDEKPWLEHIAQLTGAWLPDADALIERT